MSMTKSKETDVNMTDMPNADVPEETAVLGVASTDTKGPALVGEEIGGPHNPGIFED